MSGSYKIVPLFMVTAPNDFGVLPDNQWIVLSGTAMTLWFNLKRVDQLGERRYIVPTGGTMQVVFPRADQYSQPVSGQVTVTQQSITKTANPHADDKSLFSFAITGAEATNILSGTVKFILTVAGVTHTWLQNYTIKKMSATPSQ